MQNTVDLKPFRLAELERIIAERSQLMPEGSYTAELIKAGKEKCAKKLVEEAGEFALASTAAEPNRAHIIGEAADLFYHALVVMRSSNIKLDDLYAELRIRHEQMSDDPKSNRRGT